MILSKKEVRDFEEASKPLVKFLNDNCHPHCKVIVDSVNAEILEGSAMVRIEEFIKD